VEVKVNQSRPGIPNLSGQHKDYLVRQLYEFKCERRKSGAMNPLAKILDEKDIADLADWAADVSSYIQDCILIKSEYPECKDAGFTETAKIVKECGACHDQNDDPNDSDGLGRCRGSDSDQYCYPRLAGQKAEYLYKQLENFRSNERKSNVMNPMAKRIKDHDEVNTNMLACIAQYYCKKYK
jgi:cytochrome c553